MSQTKKQVTSTAGSGVPSETSVDFQRQRAVTSDETEPFGPDTFCNDTTQKKKHFVSVKTSRDNVILT
jgi:hypothetical protein